MEHYDSIKDPMKMYFMEKIQITVSNTKTLDMLLDMNEKDKNKGKDSAMEKMDMGNLVVDKSGTMVRRDTMDFIAEKLKKQ